MITGQLDVAARVFTSSGYIFRAFGGATLHGSTGAWTFDVWTDGNSPSPLWENRRFTRDGLTGTHARVDLRNDLTFRVDLSSLAQGELFALVLDLRATTNNQRGRESAVNAGIRDPERSAPDLVKATGVGPSREVVPEPLVSVLPAVCPGPDPAAGTLQFSRPEYAVAEWTGPGQPVLVTREGGSTGPASVTVTASDGSANAGSDYDALSTTIAFADGDTSPRLVPLEIVADPDAEPDETVNLSLSDPHCAALGEPSEAVVTIVDDDRPVEDDSFTVGGTVSGLEGSGLVLSDLGEPVEITANGAFQFPITKGDGLPYDVSVATQPSEPAQICTVANGSGEIAGADITDILVECVTPPPTSGLDPSFGDGGKVSTPGSKAEAIVVQPDGAIVTAGANTFDFVLTRYDDTGVLDESFDGDGIVTTSFGTAFDSDTALDLALQPDGKIIAVGKAEVVGTVTNFTDFAVARYHPDGRLDDTFAGDGTVTTDFGVDIDGDGVPESGADIANAVAVQPDGSIVVAGHAAVPRGIGLGFENDFAVARYGSDGTLDPDFGDAGKVTTDIVGDTDLGNAVAVQSDGRIVLAGEVEFGDDFALVRYEPDGRSLDPSFAGGMVVTDFGGSESIEGISVQPDGRIVAAGRSSAHGDTFDFAVTRYDADGSLDESFGGSFSDHLVTTDVSGGIPNGEDFGEGVAVQGDGKIVVVGRNTSDTIADFALSRYTSDGTLDDSFATDGILTTDFHGKGDFGQDVALQPDGKLVAAGHTVNGFSSESAVLRVLP